MYSRRSPPQQKKITLGGSSTTKLNTNGNQPTTTTQLSSPTSSLSSGTSSSSTSVMKLGGGSGSATNRSGGASTLSLYSNASTNCLLASGEKSTNAHFQHMQQHQQQQQQQHYAHAHAHSHHYHQHASNSGGSLSASAMKRGKKHNWGTRKRAGMSFLIVIAFFAIFGLIILTELFMIDERSHAGMMHGGYYGGRLGDSMPDYDNVKDDYDIMVDNFMGDNKLGFIQFRDNKKSQDAGNSDVARLSLMSLGGKGLAGANGGVGNGMAGGAAAGGGAAPLSFVPWGRVLSSEDEQTLPPYPAGMPPTDGSWQVVNGTRFKFFVYSAYYDQREGARLVRVVGATKTRGPERVWCRFWYGKRNVSAASAQRARYTSSTVMARVKTIRENWNLKYSACFILCPVRDEVPQYISLVARLRAPPGNLLQLRNTDWDPDFALKRANSSALPVSPLQTAATVAASPPHGNQLPDKIAVCVKPFHFDYDQALYLLEYLELYALLGVSHFTFYNHTLGPRAACVLEHYMSGNIPANLTAWDTVNVPQLLNNSFTTKRLESKNYERPTVNILPWNLRMRSQKEIRTEGLFAALNDCLYRNMYRYKYVALVDLDEFIVPRENDTLIELIHTLNRRVRQRNTGAYSFQNAFFYLQFADDPLVAQSKSLSAEEIRLRAALVTQRKTTRRFKLHPQKQRSKYICRPEAVVEAGNHFVWEYTPGKGSLNVPPADAILQHYRVCEFGGNDCIKAPSVIDRTATKYGNRLLQRVELVYRHLQQRCQLGDLPPLPKQPEPKVPHKVLFNNNDNNNKPRTERNVGEPISGAKVTYRANNEQQQQQPKPQAKRLQHTATTINNTTSKSTTNTLYNRKPSLLATTVTTTTTTNATTTNRNETAPNRVVVQSTIARRRRKYVVFENDEDGRPMAKVEYEYY